MECVFLASNIKNYDLMIYALRDILLKALKYDQLLMNPINRKRLFNL